MRQSGGLGGWSRPGTDPENDETDEGVGAGTGTAATADWTLGSVRYYAIKSTGDDSAAGFSDVSAAAAYAVAKKTWAGLLGILPKVGNGRDVQISIGVGTYLESFVAAGFVGWNNFHIVVTSDGSDSAGDRILSGFVTSSAGPGGGGVWTCAAGATVSSFTISAGALPAEPAAVIRRARFQGNVTAALTNICCAIQGNTGTVITPCDDLPVAPAVGDLFVIEAPGAIFNDVAFRGFQCNVLAVRGLASAGAWTASGCYCDSEIYTGCEAVGASSFVGHASLSHTKTFTPMGGGAVRVGTGFRSAGNLTVHNVAELVTGDCSGVVAAAGVNQFINVATHISGGGYADGCRYLSQVQLIDSGSKVQSMIWGRNNAGFRDCKHDVLVAVVSSSVELRNVNINLAGNAVRVFGMGSQLYVYGGTVAQNIEVINTFRSLVLIDYTHQPAGLVQVSMAASIGALIGDLLLSSVRDVSDNVAWCIDGDAPSRKPITTQSIYVVNDNGSTIGPGQIVRVSGASGVNPKVKLAKADTAANAAGGLLVMLTTATDQNPGYAIPIGLNAWMKCDANPAAGALLYLSPTNAGNATSTVPPVAATNQKRRLGFAGTLDTGNVRCNLVGGPELVPVTADGLA